MAQAVDRRKTEKKKNWLKTGSHQPRRQNRQGRPQHVFCCGCRRR